MNHFTGRPGDRVPSFTVFIGPGPHVIEVNGVSDRDINLVKDDVLAWVRLNHEQLLRFWFEGTTWFDEEVTAFKRTLKKIARERRPDSNP